MTDSLAITTKNLSKVYKLYRSPKDRMKEALNLQRKKFHKEFYALKDINLEIRRGEVIGIVGKNGSGKSTLLKILSRVLTPSSGEYMVRGKVSSLLELGSGFNPELTGIENIFFYGTILGFPEEKIKARLQEILDFADIGDFVYQPLKTYSSGMRSRLAFAVAINVDPDILILDEVLAVGDELFRRKCYAQMEKYFKGNKTVLFVSHSVSSINELCTRAIMLDKGEFIAEGPAMEITKQYERFLFAKPEEINKVRDEIKMIDFSKKSYDIIAGSDIGKSALPNSVNNPVNIVLADTNNKNEIVHKSKAYFLPELISKARIEYRNYEVDITNVTILSPDERKVNVLFPGELYKLEYDIFFHIPAEHISFGMMIKTEKGLILSAASTRNHDINLDIVKMGNKFHISWSFTCNLFCGLYYVNVGVLSFTSKGRITLNRIVDALVFKVEHHKSQKYIGNTYLKQVPSVIELSRKP